MFILFSDNETRSPLCQSIASWEAITAGLRTSRGRLEEPGGHRTLVQWWLWDTRTCDTRHTWHVASWHVASCLSSASPSWCWWTPSRGARTGRTCWRSSRRSSARWALGTASHLYTAYAALVDKAWWGLTRQLSIKLLVSRKFNENCKISRFLPFFENTFLLYKESPTESHLPIVPSI